MKYEVVQLCSDLHIDPEVLKPRTRGDIEASVIDQSKSKLTKIQMYKSPGDSKLSRENLIEARLEHYNKRRNQALHVIEMRLM